MVREDEKEGGKSFKIRIFSLRKFVLFPPHLNLTSNIRNVSASGDLNIMLGLPDILEEIDKLSTVQPQSYKDFIYARKNED